jgi:hypothetical protein
MAFQSTLTVPLAGTAPVKGVGASLRGEASLGEGKQSCGRLFRVWGVGFPQRTRPPNPVMP